MSKTTEKILLPAIPTTYLPQDWREIGAKEFDCSINKIERIVYGIKVNPDLKIYEYFVELAESGKREFEKKQKDLSTRVSALS